MSDAAAEKPKALAVPDKEAAKMFCVAPSTWWSWVKAGKAPQPVKIGGATRWRVSDLEQALRARTGKPAPAKAKPQAERLPRSVPLAAGTTQLYRHFDGKGQLLYVGISLSAVARLAEHRADSHWFWTIARIEVTAYASRASALKAERILIQREKPLHNVLHSRGVREN